MSFKILIVDDSVDIREYLQVILEREGYQVDVAINGFDGLNKARKIKPDLLILDVMLPHLNGYKICRMLKFDEHFRKIPIVMLTSRSNDGDEKIAEEVGADLYLNKPIEPDIFLVKINELLNK